MGDRRSGDPAEIHRLTQEVAAALGGEAHANDELPTRAVRKVGPGEWRLPESVDDEPFQRFTESGQTWVGGTPGSRGVLAELGLTPRQLTVYGSFPTDPHHEPYVGVMVYMADYVDPENAIVVMKRIFSAPDSVWEHADLGSRRVLRGTSSEFGPMGTTYLWADAMAVYQVVCPDPEYAAKAADAITPFTKQEAG